MSPERVQSGHSREGRPAHSTCSLQLCCRVSKQNQHKRGETQRQREPEPEPEREERQGFYYYIDASLGGKPRSMRAWSQVLSAVCCALKYRELILQQRPGVCASDPRGHLRTEVRVGPERFAAASHVVRDARIPGVATSPRSKT